MEIKLHVDDENVLGKAIYKQGLECNQVALQFKTQFKIGQWLIDY